MVTKIGDRVVACYNRWSDGFCTVDAFRSRRIRIVKAVHNDYIRVKSQLGNPHFLRSWVRVQS